jgi:iron complex outermembrane recepter protein
MKIKSLNRAMQVAGLMCAVIPTTSALAQQTAVPSAPQAIEKIEITGSSIKRAEGKGALPVTVITKADIDRSGATSPIELLQLVSAHTSSGNLSLSNVIGSATFSAQTASLRGLGGGRTLVLINGKRASGFAGEVGGVQGVNLAVIPFAAIERVEVLKDGASAVYGSDAIGGVINFILRKDYRGGEVSAYFGNPTRKGGGEQGTVSGAVGFGDLAKDRFNILMSVSYNDQKNLEQRDRDFSNTSVRDDIGLDGTSGNPFPGRITTGGIGVIRVNQAGVATRAAPDCFPSILRNGDCRFDPATYAGVQSIPDGKLFNFFAAGRVQFNANWEGYTTALFSKDESRYRIQPAPFSDVFFSGPLSTIPNTITLLPSSRFYPTALAEAAGVGGQPLNVRYRSVETGLRDTTDTNKGMQLTGGVKGNWLNWDWDAAAVYAEGATTSFENGGKPITSRILPLLNSGRVNLFGPNTPDVAAELRATNFIGEVLKGKSKNYGVQAKASGEIMALPAGALALAVGAEQRKEALRQDYAPLLAAGDIAGFGGSFPSFSQSRNVRAAFAELNIPIIKNLEANLAVRSDRYSDFGSTTNPKASLRWQPTKSVLVRGSWGKGFLAPSLYQLFIPQASGLTAAGTSDPIRCPVTNDQGSDCLTQFATLVGGNGALKPEKSEQVAAGIVFDITQSFSVGVDYFKIRLNDSIINGIPIATILGDLNQFGNPVTRAAPDAAFPNLPGRITNIDQRFRNLGALHIEGFDLEAHWKGPTQNWGRLSVDVTGTYFTRNDAQNPDGTFTGLVANQVGSPTSGVVPRWKHYASVTWDRGPWSATLGNTHQTSYTDVNPDADGNNRQVSAMSLWDLQGSYKGVAGIKGLMLSLGVKNVLDTNPPKTNQQTTFQVGYDPSYYDVRARFVYGTVRYEFK